MKKSAFEHIGGTYRQEGDYLLPNLDVPENVPVDIWGQRRKRYLREHRKALYTAMLLSDKLNNHLTEIDQQAGKMFSQLVEQMAKQEGITEQLKVDSQMDWVSRMNNIRSAVEEIVNTEIIFS